MKTIELSGTSRNQLGKSGTKKVRNSGSVPCVVYGNGEPQHISVDHIALKKLFYTPETVFVSLNVDGNATKTVIREASWHPVFDQLLHVDFLRVTDDKPVDVELPVKLVGTAKGSLAGGKLTTLARRLKVRALPATLPSFIEVNVTELDLGKTIKVSDLNIEGIEFISPAAMGIAMIAVPRAAKEEAAATPAK